MSTKAIALVTGGSRGIGKAVALQLAQDGFHVLLNYRSGKDAATETLQQIENSGGSGELLPFDISDPASIEQSVTQWQTANTGCYIQVLVNNAGIRKDNLMIFMSPADWTEVLRTNLDSFFTLTKLVMKDMIFHKYGRIINMASMSGINGMAGQTNYAASKGGLIAASKSLAQELARKNITVNTVAPGFIKTDMTADLKEDELRKIVPMQRFGEAAEVASVVGFLAGKSASYITGEVISVNGGLGM